MFYLALFQICLVIFHSLSVLAHTYDSILDFFKYFIYSILNFAFNNSSTKVLGV